MTASNSAAALTVAEFGAALEGLARFEDRPFVAVAVSGGPDSLALAILADRWARERGGEACAVTVDHGLRPESGAEIHRLAGWLAARCIRHEVLLWSGEKPTSRIQERARAARYRLLAQWCRERRCLHLLTAHHREDQVETHLIRRDSSSGADGLAGMSAIRELDGCRLLRPLLGFAKARLAALLRDESQPFLSDPSNRDPAFARARLRAGELAGVAGLSNRIAALGSERRARARARHSLLARAAAMHPAGFAAFEPSLLRGAPPEVAEAALSALVAAVGGGGYPVRRRRVARLREALAAEPLTARTLGGCRLVAWRGRVLVLRELGRAAEPVIVSPGTALFWDCRFAVRLSAAAAAEVVIGYLGAAGAAELRRRLRPLSLPPLLRPVLPAAWDAHGLLAVPHLGYRRDAAAAVPEIDFRPLKGLTSADFTVV
ncbi:MAG TPA: tRNA lysidine(34) synthetase TilS [Stellaceae bacterium]|nr:tRNA lysidine(34) synthetase TilS [Stellaceae bacterium]